MPATVSDLIRSKPMPVTVSADALLRDALGPMITHNYSQLPVVDADNRPLGLVTSDSIIRALNNFGVTLDGLRVYDAMLKLGKTYRPDDDLFDLLDDLKDAYAVLVVDAAGQLIGIVTSYDSTEYFRQRTQDIMFVQDIEEMIKGYITLAFLDANGDTDAAALRTAIEEITPSNDDLLKKFRRALLHYQKLQGGGPDLNDAGITDAFDTHFERKKPLRDFEDLTLAEYNQLFLHTKRWPKYAAIFSVERRAIEKLLDSVRKTRNMLAHLRGELTPQQRDEIQFCKDWLARHERALMAAFAPAAPATAQPTINKDWLARHEPAPVSGNITGAPPQPRSNFEAIEVVIANPTITTTTDDRPPTAAQATSADVAPLDEVTTTDESRYAGLIRHLQAQAIEQDRVKLTFSEIEQLIGDKLPDSARKHRAWWANDTVSHAQSQQWIDAGWRVTGLSMSDEHVTFARSHERERAYIAFFSALLSDLNRDAPEAFRMPSPDGQNWVTVGWPFNGLSFAFSFAQGRRFRIELYIDVGQRETNKQIFDTLLARRAAIEEEFGEPLSWERIDDKRASRLARYYPGSITHSQDALDNLRTRAVEAMIRFRRVLLPHIEAALREVGADRRSSSGFRDLRDRAPEPTPSP